MRRNVLLGTLACASLAPLLPRSETYAQSAAIRIAEPATEDTTNVFYGVKSGLFERAGLNVDVFYTPSGSAAVASVVSGSYDLAGSGLLSILLGHVRGIPLVVVAAENQYRGRDPQALLQIARDSTIVKASDLNGKIIGVPALNDVNTIATRAWVDKHGGDWQSLRFVEVPNSALVAALNDHRIDATVLQQPALSISLAQGTTKTLGDAWGAIAQNFLVAVYVARADWVRQNAALLKRFTDAYLEATRYVNGHLPETAQYVADLTDITLPEAQRMRRTISPTTLNVDEIQPLIDAAAKYGALPRAFSARELLPSD